MLTNIAIDKIRENLNGISSDFVFQEPTFMRDHIFYSVLNACVNDVSVTEKMGMYNLFYCFEKALYEARITHYHMARYWVRYVDRKREAFSPLANAGLSSLYYPMVAFIEYVTGNHELALEHLDRSLVLFDDLKEQGVKDVIGAATEQNLNKFRIYCAMGKFEKAMKHASELCLFVTNATTRKTADFHYDVMEMVDLNVENDWEGLIYYFINSIMAKFISIKAKLDKEIFYRFWQEFHNADNWDNSPKKTIRPAGAILADYYSDKHLSFLNGVIDHFSVVPQWPMQLQSFLFDRVIAAAERSDYVALDALRQTVEGYILKVKNEKKMSSATHGPHEAVYWNYLVG